MRKILISKPGEFELGLKKNFFRAVAVKMVAGMIQNSSERKLADKDVVISHDLNVLKSKPR